MTFGRLCKILMLFAVSCLLMAEATQSRNKKSFRGDDKVVDLRMKREKSARRDRLDASHDESDTHTTHTHVPGFTIMDQSMTCSEVDGPMFEFDCDYGTDFECPFPFVKVPFLAEPTCCERSGSEIWDDGRRCSARGGYFVMGSYPFWMETESGDYEDVQFSDSNWCCPKKTLASFINENCHGPVQYGDECGWLFDPPLVPVRLEIVALDREIFNDLPYFLYDILPCYGEDLIVCCPTEEILDKVEEGSCASKGRQSNGRRLFLKNTNDKHNDE